MKRPSRKAIKIIRLSILAILGIGLAILAIMVNRLEKSAKDQILASIKNIPASLVSYQFKAKTSEEVSIAMGKAGGFIKGICHPTQNYEQIKGAGIEWNRSDIPFPFEADGSTRQSYLDYKEKMKGYVYSGIKIMAVTPYPYDYIEFGVDPRLPENEARVKEIAEFLITDLQGLIGAMQITNELGVPRFALPLTTEEAMHFLGISLEAVYPLRGDVLVGYNTAGPQADHHELMKPYLQYCDYVGVDIYIGCFASVGNFLSAFDLVLDYLWSCTGKPIILCEFGYIGEGAPKTPEEKRAVLQRYGASSEDEARKDIEAFTARLPERMRNQVYNNASGDWGNFLFYSDFKYHTYAEMPANVVIKKYPHTPEGQAEFYRAILPRLAAKPYLIGAFIYSYADSERCYICGQEECPIETKWGLTTVDGKEKPSYYAVAENWLKRE
jgi:hypothetical protein